MVWLSSSVIFLFYSSLKFFITLSEIRLFTRAMSVPEGVIFASLRASGQAKPCSTCFSQLSTLSVVKVIKWTHVRKYLLHDSTLFVVLSLQGLPVFRGVPREDEQGSEKKWERKSSVGSKAEKNKCSSGSSCFKIRKKKKQLLSASWHVTHPSLVFPLYLAVILYKWPVVLCNVIRHASHFLWRWISTAAVSSNCCCSSHVWASGKCMVSCGSSSPRLEEENWFSTCWCARLNWTICSSETPECDRELKFGLRNQCKPKRKKCLSGCECTYASTRVLHCAARAVVLALTLLWLWSRCVGDKTVTWPVQRRETLFRAWTVSRFSNVLLCERPITPSRSTFYPHSSQIATGGVISALAGAIAVNLRPRCSVRQVCNIEKHEKTKKNVFPKVRPERSRIPSQTKTTHANRFVKPADGHLRVHSRTRPWTKSLTCWVNSGGGKEQAAIRTASRSRWKRRHELWQNTESILRNTSRKQSCSFLPDAQCSVNPKRPSLERMYNSGHTTMAALWLQSFVAARLSCYRAAAAAACCQARRGLWCCHPHRKHRKLCRCTNIPPISSTGFSSPNCIWCRRLQVSHHTPLLTVAPQRWWETAPRCNRHSTLREQWTNSNLRIQVKHKTPHVLPHRRERKTKFAHPLSRNGRSNCASACGWKTRPTVLLPLSSGPLRELTLAS